MCPFPVASLYCECRTCLHKSQARESERLLMSAEKHKAGQWIWCKCARSGSAISSLLLRLPQPRGQTEEGVSKDSLLAALHLQATGSRRQDAAALAQQKPCGDAKAFRGKHVGKVLQVLPIPLAAWPAVGPKPMGPEFGQV